jgi:tRNA A-37 threonylcarbamoyl transferase component Bud32
MAEHAMCALKAIHQQNMLHGDIALQNFVTSDTAQLVWLVDLVNVWPGTAAETAREEQVLRRLLKCMTVIE